MGNIDVDDDCRSDGGQGGQRQRTDPYVGALVTSVFFVFTSVVFLVVVVFKVSSASHHFGPDQTIGEAIDDPAIQRWAVALLITVAGIIFWMVTAAFICCDMGRMRNWGLNRILQEMIHSRESRKARRTDKSMKTKQQSAVATLKSNPDDDNVLVSKWEYDRLEEEAANGRKLEKQMEEAAKQQPLPYPVWAIPAR